MSDYGELFSKIGKGIGTTAKVAGATAVEAVLAGAGVHPGLQGDDTWSLIKAAKGKSLGGDTYKMAPAGSDAYSIASHARPPMAPKAAKGESKGKAGGKGKLAKRAMSALNSVAAKNSNKKSKPVSQASSPAYHPTSAPVSVAPYTGGNPAAALVSKNGKKDK